MQYSNPLDHTAAELSSEQLAQMLRTAMAEIAIRAGNDTLGEVVDGVRYELDDESVDRLRHERDLMLMATEVLADIAALPSTPEPARQRMIF